MLVPEMVLVVPLGIQSDRMLEPGAAMVWSMSAWETGIFVKVEGVLVAGFMEVTVKTLVSLAGE